jgi:hypothetical protein
MMNGSSHQANGKLPPFESQTLPRRPSSTDRIFDDVSPPASPPAYPPAPTASAIPLDDLKSTSVLPWLKADLECAPEDPIYGKVRALAQDFRENDPWEVRWEQRENSRRSNSEGSRKSSSPSPSPSTARRRAPEPTYEIIANGEKTLEPTPQQRRQGRQGAARPISAPSIKVERCLEERLENGKMEDRIESQGSQLASLSISTRSLAAITD